LPKLTKRQIDASTAREADYFLWDDELPGFGLRVFSSGKRSYLVQYRAKGRTRRFTIGAHGVWTPEEARREARSLLGRIAKGENPAEERDFDRKAITVRELCERYLSDAEIGLILGKKRQPKKPSTLVTDRGRIEHHIVPLLGARLVKDITIADVTGFLKDVSTGRTKVDLKTKRRGRAIVRGGRGTASRTTGLLGGIFSYAVAHGIISVNPVHGVRRPADNIRDRRLNEGEYRLLGRLLERADENGSHKITVAMIRLLALTGCRRGEVINLRWDEIDEARGCLRLRDTKEGLSIRPVGRAVFDVLKTLQRNGASAYVFPGTGEGKPFSGLPKSWRAIFRKSGLADITPHVLRHSFASVANERGFTESTIAAMLGHSRATVTARYVHHIDAVLVSAADQVAAHLSSLLDGNDSDEVELVHAYSLGHSGGDNASAPSQPSVPLDPLEHSSSVEDRHERRAAANGLYTG